MFTGIVTDIGKVAVAKPLREGTCFRIETVYDPAEINRTFRANGWANRLVNGVLRRE